MNSMRGKAERMICSVGIAFLMCMLFIFSPEQGVTPAAAEGRSDDSVIEISIQKLETVQAAAWQFAAAVPDEGQSRSRQLVRTRRSPVHSRAG